MLQCESIWEKNYDKCYRNSFFINKDYSFMFQSNFWIEKWNSRSETANWHMRITWEECKTIESDIAIILSPLKKNIFLEMVKLNLPSSYFDVNILKSMVSKMNNVSQVIEFAYWKRRPLGLCTAVQRATETALLYALPYGSWHRFESFPTSSALCPPLSPHPCLSCL